MHASTQLLLLVLLISGCTASREGAAPPDADASDPDGARSDNTVQGDGARGDAGDARDSSGEPDDAGPDPFGGGELSDDAAAALLDAYCDLLARCPGTAFDGDAQGCRDTFACRDERPIEAPNDTAAEACARWLPTVSCDPEPSVEPTPCEFGSPRVTEGEACTPGSCAAELYCKQPTQPGECPVCTRRGTLGEPCTQNSCERLLYCTADGVCAEHHADGAPCLEAGYSSECASTACIEGVCALPGKLGDACSGSTCGWPLRCVAGSCAHGPPAGTACEPYQCGNFGACRNGVCVTICDNETRLPGSCIRDDRHCAPNEYCQLDGATCAPKAAGGEACTAGGFRAGCEDGYLCEGSVCIPLSPVGTDCERDWDCASGWCHPGSLTCEDLTACGL